MINFSENEHKLKGYKFIDLFCGIGGFHLALTSFGAKCVFASDIDAEACKVYEKNFKMKPQGDITLIHARDIPKHDILCAGFPCQPFSISGNQQGFDDEHGRGKLFFDIVRIAKYHKPKILLLENVKNFEKHNNGKTIITVKEELNNIGYTVFYDVLCASDFEVPQQRKRIYIVAFRKDLKIDSFEFPRGAYSFKTLKDILITKAENKIKGNYYIDRKYKIRIESTQRDNKLIRIGEIGLGRQGERIYSINGQATTLSSQGGGLGGKTGMYLIRKKVRKLFPRECARLMGFPDDFQLSSSQEQNYKQFGNSVVVDVIQAIVKEIIKKIEAENNMGILND
jgi:DNA (cytosine-5)-methyltransferase 1